MADSIIHPKLHKELHRFFPARCTIQEDVGTQASDGHPTPDPQSVPGLVGIPCSLGPPDGDSGGSGKEIRRGGSDVMQVTHRIGLRGYYPEIATGMVAVIDGQSYNIGAVLHDSHRKSTYLDVEVVR